MKRLNLGAGEKFIEGWDNIDLYSDDPRVIKMDIRKLDYPNDSADEIWAEHCIEHCSYKETPEILREWCRVLKPGGKITIAGPNSDRMFRVWLAKEPGYWRMMRGIFGQQTNPGQFHYSALSFDYLKMLMENAGFKEITELVPDNEFHLWMEATK